MDALSEVLSTLHLASSFYCRSELSAPWGLAFPAGEVAMFHAIRRGTCWAIVDGMRSPVTSSWEKPPGSTSRGGECIGQLLT